MTQMRHRSAIQSSCRRVLDRAWKCSVFDLGEAMRRREFITLIGMAATAWPVRGGGEQAGVAVIGFMHSVSREIVANYVTAFHQGLQEAGYIEGQNVAIEYRWAQGHYDRLPELAADLVRRRVAVIAAAG